MTPDLGAEEPETAKLRDSYERLAAEYERIPGTPDTSGGVPPDAAPARPDLAEPLSEVEIAFWQKAKGQNVIDIDRALTRALVTIRSLQDQIDAIVSSHEHHWWRDDPSHSWMQCRDCGVLATSDVALLSPSGSPEPPKP